LFDLHVAYICDDDKEIMFAAIFFVTGVALHNVAYLFWMLTDKKQRKQGFAKTFIEDLKAFLVSKEAPASRTSLIFAGLDKPKA